MSLSLHAQEQQKAKTTSAVRLFQDKDDLTSVITIIPVGSIVEVLKGDADYILVDYNGSQGYIPNGNISYDQVGDDEISSEESFVNTTPQYQKPASRYDRLMIKYGDHIGKLFYQNKIWKGLSTENVLDSWGRPVSINKTYVDNIVEEEWIYSKKWLLFKNDILVEWGAVSHK